MGDSISVGIDIVWVRNIISGVRVWLQTIITHSIMPSNSGRGRQDLDHVLLIITCMRYNYMQQLPL